MVRSRPDGVLLDARNRGELDLTDTDAVRRAAEETRPDVVVNAAGYTAVDAAERDAATAFTLNHAAVATLAEACSETGARLVQISTDFVFDGAASRPYPADGPVGPQGVYARSKAAGEAAALAAPGALVVRTAWVYAAEGRNFPLTMLRLFRERSAIRVVADQIGTPTHAASLARALWALILGGAEGIHHFTDAGTASWYDFAVAVAEEALARGLIGALPQLTPIRTEDYPTPAVRPPYSVLDKTATWALLGGPAAHWRDELRRMLDEVRD